MVNVPLKIVRMAIELHKSLCMTQFRVILRNIDFNAENSNWKHTMPDEATAQCEATYTVPSILWYHLMRGNATAVNLHKHIFLLTAHTPREVQ